MTADSDWQTRQHLAHPWGVGMPAFLKLHEFGRLVFEAFGRYPVLVGSALTTRAPRDIDVRLILPQSDYLGTIGPVAECGKPFTRWAALCRAFAALGREMTGLPIDFQIQTTAHANVYADRLARDIGLTTEPPESAASRPSLSLQQILALRQAQRAELGGPR